MDAKTSERTATSRKDKTPLIQGGGNIHNNSANYHQDSPKKDVTANQKRDNKSNSTRHHPTANSNSHGGKASTNGSTAPARNTPNSNAGKHPNNNDHRRAAVVRERSFMKSSPNFSALHQEVHHRPHERMGGVQRQKSCVANLFAGQGRNSSSANMPAATAYAARTKPAMQLYRPPTLRVSDDFTVSNGVYSSYDPATSSSYDPNNKPGLNINAKEFVSLATGGGGTNSNYNNNDNSAVSFSGPNGVLKHSKSSGQVSRSGGGILGGGGSPLHHSKSGGHLIGGAARGGGKESRNGGGPGTSPPLRVHFTDDTIAYDPDNKVGMTHRSPNAPTTSSSNTSHYLQGAAVSTSIKRSKSLGSAADLLSSNHSLLNGGLLGVASHSPSSSGDTTLAANAIADMGPFSEDASKKLKQVLECPNSASARVVMEVVKQLFDKLVQGTRFAEPTARYCIAIIDRESGGETFLETLLNTCQEYYQERDRLLRPPQTTPTRPNAPPATHTKWVAYMTFLHEMYTQVKRRHRTVSSAAGPGLLLLTLLAECCSVSLLDHVTGSASLMQTECLFFILTGVGRDIEAEIPPLMAKVMSSARDALFAAAKSPAIKKTLLQLIEMNAANWQLPAQAVMYYYPGVSGK